MNLCFRLVFLLVRVVTLVLSPYKIYRILISPRRGTLPPITDRLLTLSMQEVLHKLRTRQLTSVQLLTAYLHRLEVVNSPLNAVIESRINDALAEATAVDEQIMRHSHNLDQLFHRYPLLGLPFTVKESCGVEGWCFVVGSYVRRGKQAPMHGTAVDKVKKAGAIVISLTATPEFCYSMETNTKENGICRNPYHFGYSSGGSSGGEGAVNGAGASLFGIGSDIAGSIRIPALFCGVFGHKPTGGLVCVRGHFPTSTDPEFSNYMQVGPMSRFARDLPLLLEVMAGNKASKLKLKQPVALAQLRFFYALGFGGLNGLMHSGVNREIKKSIMKAVNYFKSLDLIVEKFLGVEGFQNSMEIGLSGIVSLKNMSYLMTKETSCLETIKEFFCSCFNRSNYTTSAMLFELMRKANALMTDKTIEHYTKESVKLTERFTQLLGNNGVLLFPTMFENTCPLKTSLLDTWYIDYTLIWNILNMPATHVPMGLDSRGMPVGFSVIAAPNQDRLCLKVAQELDRQFGGWVPPTPHAFEENLE